MGERAGSAYIRCARTLPTRNPLSRVPASRRAMPGDFRGDRVIVEDPAEASALHNRGSYGEPLGGGGLSLTLLEAVYLVETGRLAVHREAARLHEVHGLEEGEREPAPAEGLAVGAPVVERGRLRGVLHDHPVPPEIARHRAARCGDPG